MRAPTVMAVLLFTTSALLARADEPPAGQKYALLVGVQQYSEAKELRPLPYSERDVTELAQVLRDGGYQADNVVLMTRAAANDDLRFMPLKKRILKELRLILADRKEGDTVLVAFAGHGLHFKDDKNSYFCPADAELDDRSTLLSLTDVYAELEKCQAGVKVLLVDACRNDPFQDRTRAAQVIALDSVTRPELPNPPQGVAAFFSCSENEKAYESDKLKHGVFFHFVIEGLKGEAAADGGDVTLLGLSGFVTQKVGDYVRVEYGVAQKPELVGRSSGAVALAHSDGAAAGLRQGVALLEKHRYAEAGDQFTEVIRRNPKLAEAYALRADALCQRLRFEDALDDCTAALRLEPKVALAFIVRAEVYEFRYEWDEAETACAEAIRVDPQQARAFVYRSALHMNKKEYEKASADCEEAVRLAPTMPRVYWARANLRCIQGKFDDAKSDCEEAIRLDSHYADAFALRSHVYYAEGDADRGMADCNEAIRLDPGCVAAFVMRGAAYRAKGDHNRAVADCTEAIRLDPKCLAAYCIRANSYFAKADYDRAVADCTEAIRIDSKCSFAFGVRGAAYHEQGDYDRAIADCTEAIRLNPNTSPAYCNRASAYTHKGKWENAIGDYSEAIRLDPRYVQAYRYRAGAYQTLGYTEKAAADLEMVRRLGGQP